MFDLGKNSLITFYTLYTIAIDLQVSDKIANIAYKLLRLGNPVLCYRFSNFHHAQLSIVFSLRLFHSQGNQTLLNRITHQVGLRIKAHFRHDMGTMRFHCAHTKGKFFGNDGIRISLCNVL